ncbi:DUF6289 family protein [Xanthomonas hortorum]|uniref:DUF6289 family protein n=1 Tax=Xanthomonas hortorum TaxID=56454 RepID=UPI0015D64C43|nr:DUF6289 family protein [Xanthomonas hortorum]MCC4623281.1 hypothetical protein [Xanthomonas campestris pv. nigromaculans]MCE4360667.1 hypothetical protein [Xanthomonas hortorum pv. taraxaci]NMI53123.1 hypothetical protein [Xanthomonas hortorum pv. taraxaci]CAD0320251.1 hypothetical protein NCPPB940_15780 [Xanthomonas hortorum pv. taraxaci]CAD0320260.1 hypothetical protein NCPPB940_15780 [Xanthomonas hortorum pv. taraxaci]
MSGLAVTPEANAATQYGRTWMWFDANENLVGQSILYCSNQTEHQGTTSTTKRVIISYACDTREVSSIDYTEVSPQLRADFCDTWGQGMCEGGPWPNGYLTSPWQRGLYN